MIINNHMKNMEREGRINWDEYFSEFSILTSKRSPCKRLQVGCILVKDNRVIATGYNGFLPGSSHTSIVRDNHEMATVHSEQNAVADCAKRGVSIQGATAYITHYPCINCFKILVTSGIESIKYLEDYKNDELIPILNKELNIPITKI